MTGIELKEAIEELEFVKDRFYDLPEETGILNGIGKVQNAIKAINELEYYYAIGTVEECREAREKQIPKKYKKIHPCKSVNYYQCPCCNGLLHMNENFCGECGQAILWEDEECLT